MAANTKTIRRSIASLKLSPNKVPTLVTYSQGIVKAMTGNAAFPSDAPALGEKGLQTGTRDQALAQEVPQNQRVLDHPVTLERRPIERAQRQASAVATPSELSLDTPATVPRQGQHP
jgi:hypothetical protein